MTERISAADWRAHHASGSKEPAAVKKRGNKFGAERTEVDGINFDSRHEAKRYRDLKLSARRGLISDLELQHVILLKGELGPILTETGRPMRLTVDFRYFDLRTGAWVYEDAKGMQTRDYLVRKAVARAMGIEVREV